MLLRKISGGYEHGKKLFHHRFESWREPDFGFANSTSLQTRRIHRFNSFPYPAAFRRLANPAYLQTGNHFAILPKRIFTECEPYVRAVGMANSTIPRATPSTDFPGAAFHAFPFALPSLVSFGVNLLRRFVLDAG